MSSTELAPLPSWETRPDDVPGAIRAVKAAIRRRIDASGRTPEEVFAALSNTLDEKVARIADERATPGVDVWPVVDYTDIEAGTVPAELVAKIADRGCAVVRNTFPRDQALAWDREIVDYTTEINFFESYTGPADDFFASVDSAPEIYPIYWSRPQMEARQSPRMARVQAFLNGRWTSTSGGRTWFDLDRHAIYPDRIRRRPPGTTSAGLAPHMDTGSIDLFLTSGYQRVFRHAFDGTIEQYDPWDAAHRTDAVNYAATSMCSAFRTFQGWTALSDMDHDQGVLHTVPIPEAAAALMLRPLLADVPDDALCGVVYNQTFPVTAKWHPRLLDGLAGIPDVRAGDTVWWHCDMVHAVAPVEDQKGWGNVMYIAATPWCPRNETYATSVRGAFLQGTSPADFPAEHYERAWPGRFSVTDLNDIGRRGLGLAI